MSDANDPSVNVTSRLGPIVVRPRWATRRTFQWLVLAAPIALVGTLGYTHRWTFDDAYVTFRTVDQVLAGNGPVFNAGERVEAFASPAWFVLLTFGDIVSPIRLEYTAASLSLLCTLIGLALAVWASSRLTAAEVRDDRAFRMPLGLGVFAVLWPVWVWSTGGMETGLTLAWLGACCAVLSRWSSPRGHGAPRVSTLGLVVLGLGWTVRPDLAVVSAVFVSAVVFGAPTTTRRRWTMAVIAAAIPVAYQSFRMGYYGMVVSSSSVAREESSPRPGFGWDFLVDFISPYLIAVPLITIALVAYVPLVRQLAIDHDRRRILVVLTIAASGVAHAATVIVIVGGDGVHARLLLPSLFAVLAPVFVVPAQRRYAGALAVCWVWALLCGPLLRPDDSNGAFNAGYPGSRLTYEDAGYDHRGLQPWMPEPGFYVADAFGDSGTLSPVDLTDRDDVVVASPGVDVLAYVLGPDVHVLDINGIGDPLTAHQRLEFRLTPGREKSLYGPWALARFADSPVSAGPGALDFERPYFPETPPLEFLEQVAWAEAALDCGPLQRLQDAYEQSLNPERFLSNVWNAMTNTSLRFDTVPSEAFDDLRCDDEIPATVEQFWEGVDVDGSIPAQPGAGAIAIAGRCDAAVASTGDPDRPWDVVEARTRTATVALDSASAEVGFAAVFVIGPANLDSSVIWISTDGNGNVQVIQNVPWFPPVATDWRPIDDAAPVEISIVPDLDNQRWRTLVNGVELTYLPMLVEQQSLDDKDMVGAEPDGNMVATTPRTAPPGAAYPEIDHERYRLSDVCQSIIAHHPSPSGAGVGRIDRFYPSIT